MFVEGMLSGLGPLAKVVSLSQVAVRQVPTSHLSKFFCLP